MAHSIRWFPSRCWVSLIFQFANCYVPNIQAIFVDSSRLSSRTISGLAFTNFCLRCRWPSNGENKCDLLKPRHLMRNLQHDFTYVFLLESVWGFVKKMMWHYIYTYTSYICTPHMFTSYICTSYIWRSCICTSYCVLSAQHTFQHLTSAHLTYHISVFSFSLSLSLSLYISLSLSVSLFLAFSLVQIDVKPQSGDQNDVDVVVPASLQWNVQS